MDLLDPLLLRESQDFGYFIAGTPDPDPATPEHGPISPLAFAAATRVDILRLANVPQQAHESANINFTPGAFAPACGEHDELRNDDGMYNTAIRRRGKSLKMFDVFEAWLNGNNPAILTSARRDDSDCP
jgi:hypothetical protein